MPVANRTANEVLSQIVGLHPEFVPAQVLTGRVLAARGQWNALDLWEQNQVSVRANELADYWLAKADAAHANDSPKEAMGFYWKSGQINPSLAEPWEKLLHLMRDQDVDDPKLTASVAERVEQIRSLYSAKDRFDKLGGISREIAIQIAEILIPLGRLWEAEAWASLATTLPSDETVQVDIVRNRIIRQLDAQTPWQVTAGHRELQRELPQSLR